MKTDKKDKKKKNDKKIEKTVNETKKIESKKLSNLYFNFDIF